MTSTFDSAHFRTVLGHVPTSVVVVAGLDVAGQPHGITIGSFVSVSLDPPLVGFFVGSSSTSWAAMEPSGHFCVNVLSDSQGELCWRFAKESENRFEGVHWSPAPSGAPIIPGGIAWIDCTVHSVTEYGDHSFVVGAVNHLTHNEPSPDAMVFFRGRVTSVGHEG